MATFAAHKESTTPIPLIKKLLLSGHALNQKGVVDRLGQERINWKLAGCWCADNKTMKVSIKLHT